MVSARVVNLFLTRLQKGQSGGSERIVFRRSHARSARKLVSIEPPVGTAEAISLTGLS